MTRPIQSGDEAEIIAGVLGNTGPNIGKRVAVGPLRGEHSQYVRIWRVHGEGLITEYGVVGTELDCAQSCLRKIEPPVQGDHTTQGKSLETH